MKVLKVHKTGELNKKKKQTGVKCDYILVSIKRVEKLHHFLSRNKIKNRFLCLKPWKITEQLKSSIFNNLLFWKMSHVKLLRNLISKKC